MGFAACSAKFVVITFSAIVLLLGIVAITVGAASLSIIDSFLADLIADHISYAFIGTGVALFIISMLGCCGACYSKSRKCSLSVMCFFTLLVLVGSVASFIVVFKYEEVVAYAAKHNFTIPDGKERVGEIEKIIYNEIKGGFTNAFDACEPTVYSTAVLKLACDESEHEECGDQPLPLDRTAMYCKADSPDSLIYPSIDDMKEAPEVAIATKGFGYWVTGYCLPDLATFEADLIDAGDGLAEGNGAYDECYNSNWWASGALTAGPKLYDWLPEGTPMNAKAVFCFCAVSAEGSKLWDRITHYSSYIKWTSLGFCIFFFFALIAECYLVCCRKQALESYYTDTKEVDMRRP